MITPEYVRMIARYNQWQNNALRDHVQAMDEAELTKDRGAFFGSILRTVNHILWADMIWMHRLGAGDPPPVDASGHDTVTPDKHAWDAARFRMDGHIREWARGLHAVDLTGSVTWTSALKGGDLVTPRAACITHMFNHQTHHRGQVHAMLTAAGRKTTDTDLLFMDGM